MTPHPVNLDPAKNGLQFFFFFFFVQAGCDGCVKFSVSPSEVHKNNNKKQLFTIKYYEVAVRASCALPLQCILQSFLSCSLCYFQTVTPKLAKIPSVISLAKNNDKSR